MTIGFIRFVSMSQAAQKLPFVPRPDLQRTLSYRVHVKWAYYAQFVVMALLAMLFSPILWTIIAHGGTTFDFVALGIGATFIGFVFAQAHFLLRPLAFSKVTVRPDSLTIDRIGQIIEIPYSEIRNVRFLFIPFGGGGFKLDLKNGKSYAFTVVLERSEYILDAVSAFDPQLLPFEKMANYRRLAILADHGWTRYYDQMKSWKQHPGIFVGATVLGASLATATSLSSSFAWALGELALWNCGVLLTAFIVSDAILMAHGRKLLLQNPESMTRDVAFENKVIRWRRRAYAVGLPLAFALAMVPLF